MTQVERDWTPDLLDPARSVALLAGDPAMPGPCTLRGRMRGGYALGLHQHPDEDEQLTVLSGTLYWSTGVAGSGAPEHALAAGGYVVFPAGTAHRVWTREDTVIQMSGVGPRTYIYVAPPRIRAPGTLPRHSAAPPA